MSLQLIQVAIDLPAALTHAELVGLTHTALADEGAVLKTIMWEAFGGPVVRPWRLERQHGPTLTVIGYSQLTEQDLASRLSVALPSLFRAVRLVGARPALEPKKDARLGLDVRLCPTVHVTPGQAGLRPGERDVYLYAVDLAVARSGPGSKLGLTREAVYAEYLTAKPRPANDSSPSTARLPGIRIISATMTGFRIAAMARKDRGSWSPGRAMPVADMAIVAEVEEPGKLREAMATGVGRQRAYGYGMLVVRAVG